MGSGKANLLQHLHNKDDKSLTHIKIVIKYFPKLKRLLICAFKKSESSPPPVTRGVRVDKILEELDPLLFLSKKYLDMFSLRKNHWAVHLWYIHFVIYIFYTSIKSFLKKSIKLLRVGVGISGKEAKNGCHIFFKMHKSKYLKHTEWLQEGGIISLGYGEQTLISNGQRAKFLCPDPNRPLSDRKCP